MVVNEDGFVLGCIGIHRHLLNIHNMREGMTIRYAEPKAIDLRDSGNTEPTKDALNIHIFKIDFLHFHVKGGTQQKVVIKTDKSILYWRQRSEFIEL